MAADWTAVVMAAGRGTRMRSRQPKVVHPVCGQPMLLYPLHAALEARISRSIVVVSPETDGRVRELLGDTVDYARQPEPLGTGHALLQAIPLLRSRTSNVLVLNGDLPLIRGATLAAMISTHQRSRAAMTLLTCVGSPPQGAGRVVRDGKGRITSIVEEAEATEAQRAITEMNVGTYCFRVAWLRRALPRLSPSAKGETYITSLVALAVADGERVEAVAATDPAEALGVNNRVELAHVEAVMRQRIRERWMLAGVTLRDPATTYIDVNVELAEDTVVHPNTSLLGHTRIGRDCQIGPNSVIRDSTIGERCVVTASVIEEAILEPEVTIGPFSHVRPGTYLEHHVHLGNFAEVKNSRLGHDTLMGHFSYVGDAHVGPGVNIGAGTITCNFDGVRKNRTVVEEGAFIGSDTMLVAPVRIGARARTGAGAVVLEDVPSDSLAVGVPARVIKRNPPRAVAKWHPRGRSLVGSASLPAALVIFGLSLALYVYTTLVEQAMRAPDGAFVRPERMVGPVGVLRLLQVVSLPAATLGLTAVLSALGAAGPATGLAALGFLLAVATVPAGVHLALQRATALRQWVTASGLDLFFVEAERTAGRPPPTSTTPTAPAVPGQLASDEREQRMIRAILAMGRTTVREVMVPRVDIVGVDVNTPIQEVVKLMLDSGHSRILVYEDTMDRVVGVAHALDILGLLGEKEPFPPLRELVRPPFFTPESKRLDELLQEFQERRLHVAIVVDEYGGTEGLVTMDDLLEEIVGDIGDEFSQGQPALVMVNETTALVDARAPLSDVNEQLGIRLEMEGVDTIGGYVYGSLGRMPHVGTRLDAGGVRIEVVSTVGHRLRKLRIIKPPPAPTQE